MAVPLTWAILTAGMAKRHRKQAVCRKRATHDIDTAKTWAIGISRALNI